MQAVPTSEVFTYPRINCRPFHISEDLYLHFPYLHFQSPHHDVIKNVALAGRWHLNELVCIAKRITVEKNTTKTWYIGNLEINYFLSDIFGLIVLFAMLSVAASRALWECWRDGIIPIVQRKKLNYPAAFASWPSDGRLTRHEFNALQSSRVWIITKYFNITTGWSKKNCTKFMAP